MKQEHRAKFKIIPQAARLVIDHRMRTKLSLYQVEIIGIDHRGIHIRLPGEICSRANIPKDDQGFPRNNHCETSIG